MVNNMKEYTINVYNVNTLETIETYVMTCNDEQLETFIQLLINENAYKIYVNNVLAYEKKDMNFNDEQFDTFIKLLTNELVYGKKESW